MRTMETMEQAVLVAKGVGTLAALLGTVVALMYPVLRAAGYLG